MSEGFSWKNRRRFLFACASFCMAVVAFVLYRDMQSEVAEVAVTMSFVTLISMTGSYVFGAAWQDVTEIKRRYR